MIRLQTKNIVKKHPNPNYFIQTRSLMSNRHLQIAVVTLSSAMSSTRQLPIAVGQPDQQMGRGQQRLYVKWIRLP